MEIRVTTHDGITPDLSRKIRGLANRKPTLLAMGEAVVSLTKRAFLDPALRPASWPERKRKYAHPILQKSKQLRKTVHVGRATSDSVEVGSAVEYAAVHQFGGKTKARVIRPSGKKALFWPGAAHPVKAVKHPGSVIPPRPFFPIRGTPKNAQLTQRANEAVARAAKRMVDAALKK